MAVVMEQATGSRPAAVVSGTAPGQERLLTPAALAFLAGLHRRFEPERQARLHARRRRQARFDAGELPDFRSDTAAIRAGDWRVAPIPPALRDRRVEITGPAEPKLVINALNSGASCFMADFEDSTAPTWANLVAGQQALRAAVAGTLACDSGGRHYTLKPEAERAVLLVRPRGWHLDERHVQVDGVAIAAGVFDLGLFAFHNARALAARDRGPYAYLPKLQSMEEAALWDAVLAHMETALELAPGQIKVTVLIETLPAAFEMDEILHALRTRIVGLNCGRWDYIFSYLKTLRAHRDRILPERAQLAMQQPFLRAYADLLVHSCHRRGAHAMGGMSAHIPRSGTSDADLAANAHALAQVRADKQREAQAGFDGAWVAHPALVAVARAAFDACIPGPHQHHVTRGDVQVDREALLQPARGSVTRAGFDNNLDVCVRYLAAWLAGHGCVPIHGLMEDAATAEIARAQLWQWLHFARDGNDPPLHLDDGTPIDWLLFERALLNLRGRLHAQPGAPATLDAAFALVERLTRADVLEDFLTLPASALID